MASAADWPDMQTKIYYQDLRDLVWVPFLLHVPTRCALALLSTAGSSSIVGTIVCSQVGNGVSFFKINNWIYGRVRFRKWSNRISRKILGPRL